MHVFSNSSTDPTELLLLPTERGLVTLQQHSNKFNPSLSNTTCKRSSNPSTDPTQLMMIPGERRLGTWRQPRDKSLQTHNVYFSTLSRFYTTSDTLASAWVRAPTGRAAKYASLQLKQQSNVYTQYGCFCILDRQIMTAMRLDLPHKSARHWCVPHA